MPDTIRCRRTIVFMALVLGGSSAAPAAYAEQPLRPVFPRGDFPPYYGRKPIPEIRLPYRSVLPSIGSMRRWTAADRRAVTDLARKVLDADPGAPSSGRHEFPARGLAVVATAGAAKTATEFKGDTVPREPESPHGKAEIRISDLAAETRCREMETRLEALPGRELSRAELPLPNVALFCEIEKVWQPVKR